MTKPPSKNELIRAYKAEHPEARTKDIAKHFGVMGQQVSTALNPERRARDERRRRAKKQQWERENYKRQCPSCGGRMYGHPSTKKCRRCFEVETENRVARMIELRKAGLYNTQIAVRMGLPAHAVNQALAYAKARGVALPPSPYFQRARPSS